jgi:Flp pilus assembly protein TadG
MAMKGLNNMRALRARRGDSKDEGAALVEFAVVSLLLFTLLFGIVEAGWAFNQQLEMRHGAREGARLTATNYVGGDAAVAAEVCDRMHFSGDESVTTVRISTGSAIGDTATVIVSTPYAGLTGFLDGIFGGATLSSEVDVRLEQVPDATLGTDTDFNC